MKGKRAGLDSPMGYQIDGIIDFFEKRVGKIDVNTRFFQGTGIDGLDAFQLMKEFGEYFKVDMSEYNYLDYHSDEADITRPFKRIFNHYLGNQKVNKTFSVSHLEKVVGQGYWSDPE
ncbi:MAG TPA: hypothetical protein DIW47_09260 [Bacteroidetes bacterium]|nr:hypothetical protein [Bacteroidota bacterium]